MNIVFNRYSVYLSKIITTKPLNYRETLSLLIDDYLFCQSSLNIDIWDYKTAQYDYKIKFFKKSYKN
jgi:hypothetical protein